MHISELRLMNVRRFANRSFPFKPGFNLVVGENGAGKSTLLRSLNAVLGSASHAGRRPAMANEDIRLNTRTLRIAADLVDANSSLRFSPQYVKQWNTRAQRTRKGRAPLVLFYGSNEATCSSFVGQRIRRFSKSVDPEPVRAEEWLYEEETRDVTTAGHCSERRFGRSRAVRDFVVQVLSKFSTKFKTFAWRFEPYDCFVRQKPGDTLVRDVSKGSARHISEAIMRHLQEMRSPFVWPDRSRVEIDSHGYLKGVTEGQNSVVPGFRAFLKSVALDEKIVSHLDECTVEIRLTPRIVVRSNEGSFLLSQLSDGEKRLFSLFVDIARQLSLQGEVMTFNRTPAVVLIDELDVHLHPKWQRMIVPALEDLFPKCQFIATTHSPFVIQATAPGKLQRIDCDVCSDEAYSGKSIEDIVEVVQGIDMPQRSKRAEEVSRAAERYFKLLRLGAAAPARELRDAELAFRKASEPFTSEPGLNALLKLESMAASRI